MHDWQTSRAKANLTGLRVLVVDDDDELRELIVEALEEVGSQVVTASSGNQAVKKLATFEGDESFHCVLADMRMPDGDGLVIARYVQSMTQNRPVLIVYSGFNDLTLESAKSFGISALLAKPIGLSLLFDCIAENTQHLEIFRNGSSKRGTGS